MDRLLACGIISFQIFCNSVAIKLKIINNMPFSLFLKGGGRTENIWMKRVRRRSWNFSWQQAGRQTPAVPVAHFDVFVRR